MKKLLIATLVALAGIVPLQGCVVAHATGQVVAADVVPDNHLRIVVVQALPATEGRNSARYVADKHMATLFPQLATRLPQDFKLNGLEATGVLLEPGSPVPPPTTVRTLVLSPTEAGLFDRSQASWLDLNVVLNDATRGVLWRGTIRFSSGSPASYDASAVDHAAVPLLEQLRDAKMIDISWRRPVTP